MIPAKLAEKLVSAQLDAHFIDFYSSHVPRVREAAERVVVFLLC